MRVIDDLAPLLEHVAGGPTEGATRVARSRFLTKSEIRRLKRAGLITVHGCTGIFHLTRSGIKRRDAARAGTHTETRA